MAEFVYGDYDSRIRVRHWSTEDTAGNTPILEIGTRGEVTNYTGTPAGLRFALDDIDRMIVEITKARAAIVDLMGGVLGTMRKVDES